MTPPTLVTDRLRLRPLRDGDRDGLYVLLSNRDTMVYWDSPAWTELTQADSFLTRSAELAAEGRALRLAVTTLADARFVGFVTLGTINEVWRSATLGYCIAPEDWGRGYATEAAAALLDWAFPTLDLLRVQAELDTRNPASARVLEKLGFQREGHLRSNCIVDGVVSDSHIYGLLVTEWRPSPEPR